MRILFWMSVSFDTHTTSEHLLTAILERLCEAGHAVHILQKDMGGPLPPVPPSLNAYPVTTERVSFQAPEKGNLRARYLLELRYLRECAKRVRSGYDAVFVQSTPAAWYAMEIARKKFPNAAITFNPQDIFPYNALYTGKMREGVVFNLLSAAQRRAYRQADHIITISEDMKELLTEDGVEPDKISVVYNWSYRDEPYRENELDYAPVAGMFDRRRFNVVYAGNIGVVQNVGLLIEAARLMRDDENTRFHIIGNGVRRREVEEAAKRYGLSNVSFRDMQPPEYAPLIYSSADVNVITLEKNLYRTALPSKTATCFACQKPAILALGRESAFARKMEREAGCLVIDSDKPEELVAAIRTAQNNPRQRTGEAFTRYFSKSKNSQAYADIITGGRKA